MVAGGVRWVMERLRSPPRLAVTATELPRVAASFDRVSPNGTSMRVERRKNPLLEIIEVRDAGRVRVRLRGELDLAGAPTISERLRRLRERGEPVLLDLDELEFIDVSGLRVLVAASEEASRDGWSFAVTRGSAPVRRLIGLVRLDRQLPLDGHTR